MNDLHIRQTKMASIRILDIRSFRKGIPAVNLSTREAYHDTNGPTLNNQYQILAPVMQIENLQLNLAAVMFNNRFYDKLL